MILKKTDIVGLKIEVLGMQNMSFFQIQSD